MVNGSCNTLPSSAPAVLGFDESKLHQHTSAEHKNNMSSLKDIVVMYQTLKREWDKKPQNLDRCGELLAKLKVDISISI